MCPRDLATCHSEKLYQVEVKQLQFCLVFSFNCLDSRIQSIPINFPHVTRL